MKKLFVFIGLMFLLGAYTVSVNATNVMNTIVVTDDDKCEKCGKEDCDGKCDANTKSAVPATEKKAEKCNTSGKKACCTGKKSAEASKEGCDHKKKDEKK